ncbi:MAG: pseudouridine synthase [Candidatus Magnetobacterium sp. LHC-1]|uniref:Pseudouridine synthase n=1 Tax=Candidatus Magnetobacterium casense TaxID=1455061 RepID=A0ABS6RVI1_9BACT|nr:pseudouridine synthase [Candidatus Magnetobacterium casensis]MBF0606054.1 rRNA pseudouridine synthase [Nitrospirota bacterium]MBV6340641.1 rRNA pseudouridine synthase [Candidatus Magnetobacterium casensis]
MKERLQKIISTLGIMSRRKAEELIVEGRVTINGAVAELGAKADVCNDHIKIDGKLVNPRAIEQQRIYVKFYKPVEVVTTLEDPEGRVTVGHFIKGIGRRVYPIGRLDYNSEGLLLLTNDGDFAHKLLHPRQRVPKTYHVKVKGVLEDADLARLRAGIKLDDGMTLPAKVGRLHGKTDVNSWIEMTIYEGRKRQIRRMLQRLDHPVSKLKRVAINGIRLGELRPGQWQYLTPPEIASAKREF